MRKIRLRPKRRRSRTRSVPLSRQFHLTQAFSGIFQNIPAGERPIAASAFRSPADERFPNGGAERSRIDTTRRRL
ncbi:hypothetical protein Zmor_017334 [Zophobas morio]|uniref:Uncharacterized protein n=1 Tax=Zophobas morio TaxID=2755281 RepID=A0AA38IC23_9CUCU|nr:hypothetical protein Zmor_017334 [Zophobas morio]